MPLRPRAVPSSRGSASSTSLAPSTPLELRLNSRLTRKAAVSEASSSLIASSCSIISSWFFSRGLPPALSSAIWLLKGASLFADRIRVARVSSPPPPGCPSSAAKPSATGFLSLGESAAYSNASERASERACERASERGPVLRSTSR